MVVVGGVGCGVSGRGRVVEVMLKFVPIHLVLSVFYCSVSFFTFFMFFCLFVRSFIFGFLISVV